MRYYELITEDYKSVTKKFIDAGADSAEVDKYITQFKALGTKLNNFTDPADKNIEAWGKRSFADFQKFVTDVRTQVTLGSQKKDSGTIIDITTPAQRAAGWNIIIPTDKSASCYHGTGTDWCVSKHNQDHFESYFLDKAETLIFCLNDQQEKWAIACHNSEFFNATNTSITQEQFDSATGLNSAQIIRSALSHAGVEPARAAAKLTSIPYLIKQLESPDPASERKILVTKNAQWAYKYALKFKPGGWPAAEPAIARDARWAVKYARYVLKAPWPAGEPAIAQNAAWAYEYARYVLKKRFPAAEPVIAQDALWAYEYAREVLEDPKPKTWGERYLAQHK